MQRPEISVPEPSDDEVDLGAVLATLWSGKTWILASALLSSLCAVAYLAVTPPTYRADALLQIEQRGNILALPSSVSTLLDTEDSSTLAEMEIIRSRQVLGRAAADLSLDWSASPLSAPLVGEALRRFDIPLPSWDLFTRYARRGDAIELSYLEVRPDWLGQTMEITSLGGGDFTVTLPDGQSLPGEIGSLVSDRAAGVALQVRRLDGPAGRAYRVTHLTELQSIDLLRKSLSVAERGRQTGIIEVSMTGHDPAATATRLNAVLRAYAEQNVSQSAAEAQKSLDFVESQLPAAREAVSLAEQKLNEYRSAQRSVDLAFETQSILTEASAVEGELRELALREEEVREKFTPNHPVYRQLLEQRASLEERLAELQGGISTLPETQREVVNLSRNLEVSQSTYVELLNRAQELRVLSASQIGSVRIIDEAATSPIPVAPRVNRVLALALLFGIAAGAGLVFLRNWLRHGIDGIQEIERLGLPVFATINKYSGRARSPLGEAPLVARDDPDDIATEAFRSLRTSLHFGMLDAQSKSVVFTSAAPGAGKSFVSANLAAVAAQAGQRVCLIDADMRRGTQRKYFGLHRGLPGLSDYLAEAASLDEVICQSGIDNLAVIPTGAFPPNPSELLMRSRVVDLLSELDAWFDLIIFDAPPVLAVTDAVVLGRRVGAVISVVRHQLTPLADLDALKRTLETSGVPLKGAVFNAFDPRKAKVGAGRYGYRYGYGYSNRYAYRRTKE